MAIGRETWPALYQQFHIMKPCRSAGSELPPLVLIAYKVFPFVCICGLPAFFEVGTWSNLGSLQNENLCKKSMVKEIVFVVGKWEMPLLLDTILTAGGKKATRFQVFEFFFSSLKVQAHIQDKQSSCYVTQRGRGGWCFLSKRRFGKRRMQSDYCPGVQNGWGDSGVL